MIFILELRAQNTSKPLFSILTPFHNRSETSGPVSSNIYNQTNRWIIILFVKKTKTVFFSIGQKGFLFHIQKIVYHVPILIFFLNTCLVQTY